MPVPRPSLLVGDGNHLDPHSGLAVDDVVRESVEQVAPRAGLESRPDRGSACDDGESPIHLAKERFCRLLTSLEVPVKGVLQLPAGLREVLNLNGPHLA